MKNREALKRSNNFLCYTAMLVKRLLLKDYFFIQMELGNASKTAIRAVVLNALLEAYKGCVEFPSAQYKAKNSRK